MLRSSSISPNHHAVKFYPNEVSLFTTVGGFLGQGLVNGQPALVIATEPHVAGIFDELRRRTVDVDAAVERGDLIVLDARATLDRFMVDGSPDSMKFADSVGRLIAGTIDSLPARALVRAYGEMVDLLWKDRLHEAAIRLEILWNQLAEVHGFALLCGYAMGNFYKQTELFERVCRQHSHVHPPDPAVH